MVQADPFTPRLRTIDNDDRIKVGTTLEQPSWTCHLKGDTTEYFGNESFGTVVLRSLRWPGAFTFFRGGQTQQIYVGNGLKFEQAQTFYPDDPPLIESDPAEYDLAENPEQRPPVVEEPKEGQEGGEPNEDEQDDE